MTVATAPRPAVGPRAVLESGMTHEQVLRALSGLLLGLFVAILSSTVVTTSLPRIIGDLGGGQASYTWVVTASLLALTVSTPIWGKLADLADRKLLVQTALGVFVAGSLLAGLAHSTSWLIGCRAIQGLGAGGLTALVQVILADLVSPRERGRYSGYLGATFGLGTVAGPLLGGVITDAFGWRWCFYVAVPFALAAFAVLQRTLDLPRRRRPVTIDIAGATLVAAGVSSVLVWVSLAGQGFAWVSATSAALAGGGLVLIVAAVLVERRVREPLIPLRLFEHRTVVIATVASVAVGIAMFGTTVFLSQYMQTARGQSPTASGLLTIPMVAGLFVASTLIGRLVSRTGRYKRFMLTGTLLLSAGLALMGTIDERTSLVEVGAFMVLVGAGIGMVMQNLVLVVQNTVNRDDLGAGSSIVSFFRSLGGAVGVSVLGAVLAAHVSGAAGPAAAHAYGTDIAQMFLLAAPLGLVAFVALLFLEETPLGTRSGIQMAREGAHAR